MNRGEVIALSGAEIVSGGADRLVAGAAAVAHPIGRPRSRVLVPRARFPQQCGIRTATRDRSRGDGNCIAVDGGDNVASIRPSRSHSLPSLQMAVFPKIAE